MAGIAYHGAVTTGHGTAPPTTVIATQDLVYVEGKPAVVEGDRIVPHSYKDDSPHGGVVISSNDVVYIMGKKVGQIGDDISCGDVIAESSSVVFME